MSADFSAQEVRETANVTHDPELIKVFQVYCMSCGEKQSKEISVKRQLDIFSFLKPIVGDYSAKLVNYVRKIMEDDEKYPQVKVINSFNKDDEEVNVYQEVDNSICCPKCGKYDWSEPDPHSLTAKRVFDECKDLSLGEIKKRFAQTLRNASKVLQFLMLYGGNEFTLADRLYQSDSKEDVAKAKSIIDTYFESNPYLRKSIRN